MTEVREPTRAADLVVGKHLYSPSFFVALLVTNVVLHVTGGFDVRSMPITPRAIAVLMGTLANWMVVVGGQWLATRRANSKIAWVGLLTAGVFRGIVLQMSLVVFGLTDFSNTPFRVVSSTMVIAASDLVFAYLLGLRSYWIAIQRELDRARGGLRALLERSESELETLTRGDISEVSLMLQEFLNSEDADQPAKAKARIQDLIDSQLRPYIADFVTRTYAVQNPPPPNAGRFFNWLGAFVLIKAERSIWPMRTSLLMFVLGLPLAVNFLGVLTSLKVLVAGIALSYGFLALVGEYLPPILDRLPARPRVLGLVIASAASQLPFTAFIYWFLDADSQWVNLSVMPILAAPIITITAGLLESAQSEMDSITRQTAEFDRAIEWETAEWNGRVWHHKQTFARLLHGPIQAELAATAIRLGKLTGTRNSTSSKTQVTEVAARISAMLNTQSLPASLAQVMSDLNETWEGICDIHYAAEGGIQSAFEIDPLAEEVVVEIVREVCSNAIRHGDANRVELSVARSGPNLIALEISNNGRWSAADASRTNRGMGSLYIEECTLSSKLFYKDGLVRFSAMVPLREGGN